MSDNYLVVYYWLAVSVDLWVWGLRSVQGKSWWTTEIRFRESLFLVDSIPIVHRSRDEVGSTVFHVSCSSVPWFSVQFRVDIPNRNSSLVSGWSLEDENMERAMHLPHLHPHLGALQPTALANGNGTGNHVKSNLHLCNNNKRQQEKHWSLSLRYSTCLTNWVLIEILPNSQLPSRSSEPSLPFYLTLMKSREFRTTYSVCA